MQKSAVRSSQQPTTSSSYPNLAHSGSPRVSFEVKQEQQQKQPASSSQETATSHTHVTQALPASFKVVSLADMDIIKEEREDDAIEMKPSKSTTTRKSSVSNNTEEKNRHLNNHNHHHDVEVGTKPAPIGVEQVEIDQSL